MTIKSHQELLTDVVEVQRKVFGLFAVFGPLLRLVEEQGAVDKSGKPLADHPVFVKARAAIQGS